MEKRKLTREQVEQIVREARERGRSPDLSGADLSGVDLSGADLSEARLTQAKLIGADLSQANLTQADLSGADLTLTKLDSTNFSKAITADTIFVRVLRGFKELLPADRHIRRWWPGYVYPGRAKN